MATNTQIVTDIHPASWHAERALGIGGSEVSSLFNAGCGCKRRLVYEKRGAEPDYHRGAKEEAVLRRGNRLEDVVADEFVTQTGLKVRKQPARVSKTHPHARVNMDRQIVAANIDQLRDLTMDESGFSIFDSLGEDCGPGALECKTMNEHDFRRIKKDGFLQHDHYLLQLQDALAVTGYRWGFFCIMCMGSFETLWFPMLRNETLIGVMLEAIEDAWADYMLNPSTPLPPQLPEGDKRCARCLYRKTCRGNDYLEKFAGADFAKDYVEVADAELIELATDFVAASEGLAAAEAVRDEIKQRIRAYMEEHKLAKMSIPEVQKFCLAVSTGRKAWDGKALEGEVNHFRKIGQPEIADRIAACQKTGAPITSFRPVAA